MNNAIKVGSLVRVGRSLAVVLAVMAGAAEVVWVSGPKARHGQYIAALSFRSMNRPRRLSRPAMVRTPALPVTSAPAARLAIMAAALIAVFGAWAIAIAPLMG